MYTYDTRAKVGGYKSRVVSIFRKQLPKKKKKKEIRDHCEFYTNGLYYCNIHASFMHIILYLYLPAC